MPSNVINSFLYLFFVSTFYLILGLLIDLGAFSFLFKSNEKKASGHASGNYSIDPKKNIKISQEIKNEENLCSQLVEHASSSSPSLLISKITKSFTTLSGKFNAVDNLSFNIPKNSIFGLLGPNGAGKTTLMKMITSLENPNTGEIYVEGLNIKGSKEVLHRILGVCPQFDCLYPEMTVEEHFLLFIRLRGVSSSQENIILERTLKQMGLVEHKKKQVSQLSGGMKRRVSIGIALCGETKLILLDEPTSGLDPVNRQQIWGIIKKLKTSRAILLTTHLMDEAEALCDRVGIIIKGKLVTIGNQGFLKTKYSRGIHLKVKFVKTDYFSK
jgi:ABC-type multidrug transport system ATPase subunit